MMKPLLVLIILLAGSVTGQAQTVMPDAAMQANYLLVQKAGDAYERVDGYRVKGSPYLFGMGNKGTVWQAGAAPTNAEIFYNVYQQKVYVKQGGSTVSDILIPNVDSFEVQVTGENYNGRLRFVNGKYAGLGNDMFVQKLEQGGSFVLYKQYTMQMMASTTNLMESDLRTYELSRDFYLQPAGGKAQKLRQTQGSLAKAVKPLDISGLSDYESYQSDFERAAISVVAKLNAGAGR